MRTFRIAGAAALLASALALAPAAGAAVQPTRELTVLADIRTVYAEPDLQSQPLRRVTPERPLTGITTRLPVYRRYTSPAGQRWLLVRLPGRPNGLTGWIREGRNRTVETAWHLVVSRRQRVLRVFRKGRLVRTIRIVIGKRSTPTPVGSFFIEEGVPVHRSLVGAPFALATSARSNVLQEFAGGPGQIALHGTRNIGGVPGTAVSHGCMRMPTAEIRWLARRIGAGTPLTITA